MDPLLNLLDVVDSDQIIDEIGLKNWNLMVEDMRKINQEHWIMA